MKNQTYRMTMLFDFYGDILTERQRELFDLYYNEDLSLAEIAENCGISRQGVRDVIVRAEAAMNELEDKTGLLKRFMRMQDSACSMSRSTMSALNGMKSKIYGSFMVCTASSLCGDGSRFSKLDTFSASTCR